MQHADTLRLQENVGCVPCLEECAHLALPQLVLLPRPDLLQLPVQGQLQLERLLLVAPRLLVQRLGLLQLEGLLVQAYSLR
jgi:hypothetical protein